jgi:hypothetical protein
MKAVCPACQTLAPIKPGLGKNAGKYVFEVHDAKTGPCVGRPV